MWISSAGKKGDVRRKLLEPNEKAIKNKITDGNEINRFNDAEQTLKREADVQSAELLAMAATRDVCGACQAEATQYGCLCLK